MSFGSLLCLLDGLVAITGMCHTCNVCEATVIGMIGFLAAIVYFGSPNFVRYKVGLDDPLQVMAIHLFYGTR